jgi:Domain of unknown function (DUF4145)
MKCPHCRIAFHDSPRRQVLGRDSDGQWLVESRKCPECQKEIYTLICSLSVSSTGGQVDYLESQVRIKYLVRPKGINRQPPPQDVPPEIVAEYNEAALVLSDSPKASAALSRRCLQHLLRDVAKIKAYDLSKEIDDVIALGVLPSNVTDELDKVRTVGNFAAHPNKSTSTGVILDVEPGEAEWNLEVLEDLFDFYFVRLARSAKLKADINLKLIAAGKQPLP